MDSKPGRISESPARTIDSKESTSASVETIVNRSKQILKAQTAAMEHSVNMTNSNNKNSLTNSQISMISSDQRDSHIYTSPDLIVAKTEKPPVQKPVKIVEDKSSSKEKSVEQRSSKSSVKNEPFPVHIILGVVQLVLSVALAALGGLLLARSASLATTGSGLWAGAISAIAGALGVINLRKVQTGFLAVSLICVASSTLALALTGIGLVRDINKSDQQETNIQNTKAAVSAGSGLIFALILHFVVSIASVYYSALKLCSRHSSSRMLENVITVNNASVVSQQQKVEEYIKSMSSQQGREKILSPENCDKLMAMWMYQAKRGVHPMNHVVAMPPPQSSRPVMLVPAATGNGIPPMLPPGYRHTMPMMFPPGVVPPGVVLQQPGGMPYPSMLLPQMPPGSTIQSDILRKMYASHRPTSEISKRPQRRRTGRNEASKRQRRKSESDAENTKAFTYTGLDRAIADSFLERQEISHAGSNVDYSSSNESSRDGCPDIVM